jgi:hypothetical protein
VLTDFPESDHRPVVVTYALPSLLEAPVS